MPHIVYVKCQESGIFCRMLVLGNDCPIEIECLNALNWYVWASNRFQLGISTNYLYHTPLEYSILFLLFYLYRT